MKILTLALLVSLGGTEEIRADETVNQTCDAWALMAENTMRGRQIGVSLGDSLNAVKGNVVEDLLRAIILSAWSQPRYDTPAYQQRAISDFRDEQHRLCLQMLG